MIFLYICNPNVPKEKKQILLGSFIKASELFISIGRKIYNETPWPQEWHRLAKSKLSVRVRPGSLLTKGI